MPRQPEAVLNEIMQSRRAGCAWFLPLILSLALALVPLAAPEAGGNMRQAFNAEVPGSLVSDQGSEMLTLGYLDVTRPPYNADNTGEIDATSSLQKAIDDAYRYNLVTWFPKGTYLVSDQLTMIQQPNGLPGLKTGKSQRKYANILQGDSTGGTYPILKLKDGSQVKDDMLLVFKFAWTDGEEQYGRHYNAALRGLSIDLGNNPSVTGVRFNGAQYCVIEDVEIYGHDFNVGVDGIPGGGGSTANLSVRGGRIGIQQDNYAPNPQITGLRLEGQEEYGVVLLNSMGPLILIGMSYHGQGPAVYVRAGAPTTNLNLIDARIEVTESGVPAIANTNRDTYLRNVFAKADVVAENAAGDGLPGDAGAWTHVGEYAFIANPDVQIVVGEMPADPEYRELHGAVETVSAPAEGLVERHIWDVATFPNHYQPGMIDPRAFGATPDDESDDDAPALSQALEESAATGNPVFLQRGHWHIQSPVEVPGGAALVGASNTISVLHVAEAWAPSGPSAAVRTEDSAEGVVLSHFAILGQQAVSRRGLEAHKYISFLDGRSADSIIRVVQISQIETWKAEQHFAAPAVRFSGRMGGKVYNLVLESGWRHHEGGSKEDGYALIDIDGTSNPLAFYQPNTEQLTSGPQTRIRNARNVTMYGYKYEPALGSGENHVLLEVIDSANLGFFGGAGIYTLKTPGDAIVQLSGSSDYVFANWSRNPRHALPNDREGAAKFDWITNGSTRIPAHQRSMGIFREGTVRAYGDLVGGPS